MIYAADPITRASATYRNAIRLPHKSGPAFEVFAPRKAPWVSLGSFLAAAGFWIGFLAIVGMLLAVPGQ